MAMPSKQESASPKNQTEAAPRAEKVEMVNRCLSFWYSGLISTHLLCKYEYSIKKMYRGISTKQSEKH